MPVLSVGPVVEFRIPAFCLSLDSINLEIYNLTRLIVDQKEDQMEKADIGIKLKAMPFEEKIKLLGEEDKAYIRGYIEKAVLDYQKLKNAEKHREKAAERGELKLPGETGCRDGCGKQG
jgi:hypothetical protein